MAPAVPFLPILATDVTYSAAGIDIRAVRLWVEIGFSRRSGGCLFRRCLLDTGAPLSVVPLHVHQARDLNWQPLPGAWPPGLTTWSGVPCTLGIIDVWLPLSGDAQLRGPLRFIAKFAQATPAYLPANVPVLLGLNFLAEQRTDNSFQCHTAPQAGSILLP